VLHPAFSGFTDENGKFSGARAGVSGCDAVPNVPTVPTVLVPRGAHRYSSAAAQRNPVLPVELSGVFHVRAATR
jgi:hypothetical protein